MASRAEVEALLAEVNVHTGRKAGLIAELCRRWLAVEDAPVAAMACSATVNTLDDRATIRMHADATTAAANLIGQRVRIVLAGDGNG